MSAREEILDRIRASLADRPPVPDLPRAYRTAAGDHADLIGLFADRLADYRALVHRCAPPDLPAVIAEALAHRGARRLAVPAGVDAAWLSRARSVEAVRDVPPLAHADLDTLDGVLTGCAIAIADTGTIVLDGGPDQGRRALSLLPDYQLCIVPVSRIVGSVPEAVARLDPVRPQTWISGPSATSDIELQRVEGVHGPRMLEVVIVEDGRQG